MATKAKKKLSRLARELVETANDMNEIGLMDDETHEKITMRRLSADTLPKVAPLTPGKIVAMRTRANMSQAVFARHLNLTVGYCPPLEFETKFALAQNA